MSAHPQDRDGKVQASLHAALGYDTTKELINDYNTISKRFIDKTYKERRRMQESVARAAGTPALPPPPAPATAADEVSVVYRPWWCRQAWSGGPAAPVRKAPGRPGQPSRSRSAAAAQRPHCAPHCPSQTAQAPEAAAADGDAALTSTAQPQNDVRLPGASAAQEASVAHAAAALQGGGPPAGEAPAVQGAAEVSVACGAGPVMPSDRAAASVSRALLANPPALCRRNVHPTTPAAQRAPLPLAGRPRTGGGCD